MLNTIYIMGRLTADPISRTSSSGKELATFSVAVQRPRHGDSDPETDFFDCVAWDRLGGIVCEHYVKGEMILLVGTLRNRRYTDKEGNERRKDQIVVREVHFTGGKKKEPDTVNASETEPAEYFDDDGIMF